MTSAIHRIVGILTDIHHHVVENRHILTVQSPNGTEHKYATDKHNLVGNWRLMKTGDQVQIVEQNGTVTIGPFVIE